MPEKQTGHEPLSHDRFPRHLDSRTLTIEKHENPPYHPNKAFFSYSPTKGNPKQKQFLKTLVSNFSNVAKSAVNLS